MSKTLTPEDIKAISKEIEVVLGNCLKKLNLMEATSANELMNVDELSEKLKLSKQSIYKLIKEEQIKSVKIGKNFYIKKGDFNNYIDSKY
jgi:excisionase family DNA binding protein